MHEDLVLRQHDDLDTVEEPFSFTKVRYVFSMSGRWNRHRYIVVDELPRIPRVGENVEIPFFKAYLDERNFYVTSIDHRLDERGQEVHISLRSGYFNLYLHYRREKGLEEAQLSIHEYLRSMIISSRPS